MQAAASPITQLVEAIKKSERFKGVAVAFGSKALNDGGAPPRVVIVPTTEEYEVAENDGNLIDAPLVLVAHVWGKTFDQARELRNRLLLATFDFQVTTDLLRLRADGGEWNTDEDDEQQGIAVVMNFTVRDTVEKVALSADGGSGSIDDYDLQPAP